MTEINPLQAAKSLDDLVKADIHYLTKWITIDKPEKLESIKKSQLYAGYSAGFNDVFDSQIRINKSEKRKISCVIANEDTHLDVLEALHKNQKKDFNRDDYYVEELSILIEQLHSTNIACFSELNPLLLESNHMWGLYGSCGYGIALRYKVGKLKQWIATSKYLNSSIHDVVYSMNKQRNNKLEWLKYILEILVLDNSETKIEKSVNTQLTFLSYKSQEWQFEKEWRFLNMSEALTPKQDESMVDYVSRIAQHKKDLNNCLFDFIKPDEIIFGWNNHESKDSESSAYTELEKWAKENHIKCTYLDNKLNYVENKFKIRPKRLPK